MDHLVACLVCGGIDPNADSLLLQAAIAGGLTAPWMLRAKLQAFVARLRGRTSIAATEDTCSVPHADDPEAHADH